MAKRQQRPVVDHDAGIFEDVKQHAQQLVTDYSTRKTMDDQMERMFFMDDPGGITTRKADDKTVKLTISPTARVKLQGAVRLLIAAEPLFKIPFETSTPKAEQMSEPMEKLARLMWMASGRQIDFPVHYDAVLSALLYGEQHIAVSRTAEMVETAKARGAPPAEIAREEWLAETTPYYFEAWNPTMGYTELDNKGTTTYLRSQGKMPLRTIRTMFPNVDQLIGGGKKPWDMFTLNRWWDLKYYVAWLGELAGAGATASRSSTSLTPLVFKEHGLDFIPIVSQVTEGSMLFPEPHRRIQPFLYTLWKSGLWERETLAFTVYYTLLFALGSNAQFLYKARDPKMGAPRVDHDVIGGVTVIGMSEEYGPLAKQVIDPALAAGLELAGRKSEEATIYGQALGQPPEGQAPYSLVALLHQAGRLPLISPQRLGSWGMGKAMEIAFRWMKKESGTVSARYLDEKMELDPKEIPDRFQIEAALEIALPQDQVTQGAVASRITEGEDPLVSKRWAREMVLKIGQSDKMQQEVWSERAGGLAAQQFFSDQLAEVKEKMARAMLPTPQVMQQMLQQMLAEQAAQQRPPSPEGRGAPEGAPLPAEEPGPGAAGGQQPVQPPLSAPQPAPGQEQEPPGGAV